MNRQLSITLLCGSTLLATACGISQAPDAPAVPEIPVPPLPVPVPVPTPATGPKVRFIAFGDAGRANAAQTQTGAAMAQFCKLKGCDFALEFGDNFYDTGVGSVTDAQWQTKFEMPYKDFNFPVYPTLGNHDNSSAQGAQIAAGEGSDNARGNFQVAYTDATGTSGKWKLPKRYHSFTAPLVLSAADTPLVEFFVLDSSPLAATVADPMPAYNAATYGPTQLQWFQSAITASKAKWKIAFGHHPYVSNGAHGNAGSFEGLPSTGTPLPVGVPATANGQPWKDLLDKSVCAMKVDFYMFGHDHDIEWLKPVATCNDKTEFILSGAGSNVRTFGNATRNPTFFQKDNRQGFFWFEVEGNKLTGEVYVLDADPDGTNIRLPLSAAGQPVPAFVRSVSK